jgi:Ca-activated chloride channel family protein
MGKKSIAALLLLLLAAASVGAINLSLAQIDASRLLLSQEVDLYVGVSGADGSPLRGLPAQAFRVFESADGKQFQEVRGLTAFSPSVGTEGITFLMLIDNSGSMYDSVRGGKTSDPALMRITHAKEAVRSFLTSMSGPADRVGLAAYNTFYRGLVAPGQDRERVAGALEGITRPQPEEAYTELYASLTLAVREFAASRGRKAIIILSDGENYPYAKYSGKPHPEFKNKIYAYTEPIRACLEEGITVYAVNFGPTKDRDLRKIALETGGQVFDASNRAELAGVYRRIHEQVAAEYRLTYRAGMQPAERKYVRARVTQGGSQAEATRFYFSTTVFGLPLQRLSWWLLVPLVLAALGVWLVTRLRLESLPGPARLQVLHTRVGSASTRVLPLGGGKTVIGGSKKADITIAGAPGVQGEHATVLFDPKNRSYTVVGGGDIMVNNRPVKSRRLEAGDVIDVGGATIVFDDGQVGGAEKPKPKSKG